MTFSVFLKLVEIQTKLASLIPFIIGSLYALYRYENFKVHNFVVMFISMITFDMATTAINNYYDYKKAIDSDESDFRKNNVIGANNLKESTVVASILTLLLIASAMGIALAFNTNIVVLAIGVLCFIVGIFYTFGPIPISRMPLGEIFSGFFMGGLILFLSVYIHVFDKGIIDLALVDAYIYLRVNFKELIYIAILTISPMVAIANIMLANNICDIEEDIINNRFTLVYYIGKKYSLVLYKSLYYIGYLGIAIAIILRILPIYAVIVFITIKPVSKNIKVFKDKQLKSETFALAVKNFVIIHVSLIFVLGIAVILKALG